MTSQNTNKALTGPIITTFLYYLIPSVIGLVAITTANIVDGMFLGNTVGEHALAVITLLIPYLTLLFALALMLAIGGSVRAGIFVGENNMAKASFIFSLSLVGTVLITLFLTFISLAFEQQLFNILHIPEALRPSAKAYFDIIRWVMVIQLLTMVLYYFVRADGHPLLATGALITGALLNIILDALFIVKLDMGLAGAAYATAIAQLVQFCVLSLYFLSKHRVLSFYLPPLRWKELWTTAIFGFSEFVNEISVGLIFLLLNGLIITRLGTEGVAAFSVANYFIFLSVMIYYGIADALHLLVSQNYGAKNTARVLAFGKVCALTCICFSSMLIALVIFARESAASWFLEENAQDTLAMAAQILLLISPIFLVNGLNINVCSFFTAIHKPKIATMIATTRSLVFPASLLMIFYYVFLNVKTESAHLSEWSFLMALPTAEWCAFLLALYFLFRNKKALKC